MPSTPCQWWEGRTVNRASWIGRERSSRRSPRRMQTDQDYAGIPGHGLAPAPASLDALRSGWPEAGGERPDNFGPGPACSAPLGPALPPCSVCSEGLLWPMAIDRASPPFLVCDAVRADGPQGQIPQPDGRQRSGEVELRLGVVLKPLVPNVESNFCACLLPQFGQVSSGCPELPRTSFSNSSPQSWQRYSYMGMRR